jgi:CubicO group peptidase (beta-lactamase class C family)
MEIPIFLLNPRAYPIMGSLSYSQLAAEFGGARIHHQGVHRMRAYSWIVLAIALPVEPCRSGEPTRPFRAATHVSIVGDQWHINGRVTGPGAKAEGLLMNVRMVNATFEDRNDATRPQGFDPDANANAFIRRIPDYARCGIRAVTLGLQGGHCGYEGAINSAFHSDGSLREVDLQRVRRVIEACDQQGLIVILGCYYQRADQILKDETALRAGVVNTAKWVKECGFTNLVLEIANEYGHGGFDHTILKTASGVAELIELARRSAPKLLVSASGLGHGALHDEVAQASDCLLIHLNTTKLDDIPRRIAALKKHRKPILVNEDDRLGDEAAKAARLCVANGASWGFMHKKENQFYPFRYGGANDDPRVYAAIQHLTTANDDFPPPESRGGWPKIEKPEDLRRLGLDPGRLAELKDWLLKSDNRNFAAVVIYKGTIVLEVERNHSAATDSRRVASVSKAVCATVLAIASERSRQAKTPRTMTFDDPAFEFIPQARPLSDPRKAKITVRQLLNHTSGICPEATGAKNDGSWEYVLGQTNDTKTEKLAFDPGTACGYSTHAFHHASLVCKTVTGQPYDTFAIEALFKPIGCEKWWFQTFESVKHGQHPSHGLGMPARDLARIAYCMYRHGRWADRQVIPRWFVEETAAPTHDLKGIEMRFKRSATSFSHGWELPALLGESGRGIPRDARYKPGSGGQLMAFVPSLDLVVTRQTGSSGAWEYEEYLRRACALFAGNR